MKRALVIGLMILGIGLSAAAAGFSGNWDTDIVFEIDGTTDALTVTSFTSILDVDYTVGDWVFGANMFIDMDELFDLNFDIAGVLGAFSFYSFLNFDPTTPAFSSWENLAKVSIAGVDLYAAFAMTDIAGVIGTGFAIGAHGVAGDVEIWAEADFNIAGWGGNGVYWAYNYGWDILHDWGTYYDCTVPGWESGFWAAQTASCTSAFSDLTIYVELPLACLDLLVMVDFNCTVGFNYIQFDLNDIDLGAGWFQLDDLNVKFTVDSKTVTTDFTATFGDAVCIKPYWDIVHDFASVTAIDLDALLLSYTYNGVTIKAGELFPTPGNYYVGFTKSGSLNHYPTCVVPNANEFIGVWFDGDSCCGGLIDASFVVFFDGIMNAVPSASTGIFDFILMVANVEVGIGSGFSIRGGLEVSDVGLELLSAGFTFSF